MKKILFTILLIACNDAPPRPAQPPAPPAVQQHQAYFNPITINEGDTVAGLILAKRDAVNNPQSPVGATGSFQFRGEVELHGGYRAHFDYPEVQKPCFWVDREDWRKLPRAAKETRIVWFCFANDEQVIKQLGPLSKDTTRAAIVIDDYTTNLFESDVWDTARLVRVLRRSTSAQ
ncbi:MAG TPA: hypothetical protein VM100_07005 [Longimicrobiales bacterium]|nr:hypothetical protein [Longimicrobiales bacterium]